VTVVGPRRRLVLEADGGSRGNPGPAAYGTVIRDADSAEVLAEDARPLGTTTNNVAEYRGLIAGLNLVLAVDPDAAVEVRMDSKLVIEQMAGRWRIRNADLQPLAQEARRLLPEGQVRWNWVPREENRRADQLVNAVLDGRIDDVLEHPLPDGVLGGTAGRADPGLAVEAAPRATLPGDDGQFAADPALVSGPTTAPHATTTTLLFLRHGRTSDNVARRYSGPGGSDVGLDEVGRGQAGAVARALSAVDVIVSSPMRRTMQTATTVAAGRGLAITEIAALQEYDSGAWNGLTEAESARRDPALHAAWEVAPDVPPPGGESVRAVAARVSATVADLVDRHRGRTVLVVSHAVPIACALLEALDAPLASAPRLAIRNCSLTRIRYPLGGPPEPDVILLPAGVALPEPDRPAVDR
jgi:broad specificity phosphatase PhoE/ribonuclease HI